MFTSEQPWNPTNLILVLIFVAGAALRLYVATTAGYLHDENELPFRSQTLFHLNQEN
jgi:hypothetical protein